MACRLLDRSHLFCPFYIRVTGFPGGSDGKESTCNAGDPGSIPGLWEDPLEEGMATHSSILGWRIPMDRGAWWGYSPWGCRVGHNGATKHSTGFFLTLFYHCILYMGWKRALKLVFWFIFPWANASGDDEDNYVYLRTLVIELGTLVWWDSRLSLWMG